MATGLRASWATSADCLAAAQRGDRSAQSALFTAHRDRVARQLLRMVGDPTAVDDLVQDVFITAFTALPGFRGEAALSTWLYTIATNKVRSWWDSQRRRRAREQTQIGPSHVVEDTPEDDLMAAQERQRLYDALGRLPHKLREAFVARAIEGMSLIDASTALGAPISTISYRTRRAEQCLCEALGIPWPGGES